MARARYVHARRGEYERPQAPDTSEVRHAVAAVFHPPLAAARPGKRIAILATDGVEGGELISPREALEQFGVTVEILAPKEGTIQLSDQPRRAARCRWTAPCPMPIPRRMTGGARSPARPPCFAFLACG